METYDQEITTAEDMIELVDDWMYGNVTMEQADEIVFYGEPYYDGTWKQHLHDITHRYTLIIEPNGDVRKE
nr:MAG TPA: hypothetical protein [Caudoviricetes sp.]